MSANVNYGRSIHLSRLAQVMNAYDQNRDGMDRNEINNAANAAYQHGDYDMFECLSTFIKGGQDGNGLMPEIAGSIDGKIQWHEVVDLANQNGNSYIDEQDFQMGFQNARPGGNTIYPPGNNYGGYPAQMPGQYGNYGPQNYGQNHYGNRGYGGGAQQIIGTVMKLLQQLLPLLLNQGGGRRW